MKISEQRRKDLENSVKAYIKFFKEADLEIQQKYLEYSGYYAFTNEYLGALLKKANYSYETKTLTVLSSGDQVFNLVSKGIESIDTFDINRLTEYFALGFKKVAIENLTFEQFKYLFEYYNPRYSSELEKAVIESAPDEYKWFWTEYKYLLKQLGFNASVFDLAKNHSFNISKSLNINTYLQDQKKYHSLQQRLQNVKINFEQCDITSLSKTFGKYDLILLSNIIDYYGISNKKKPEQLLEAQAILQDIFEANLNSKGEMLLVQYFGTFTSNVCNSLKINGSKNSFNVFTDKIYSLRRKK